MTNDFSFCCHPELGSGSHFLDLFDEIPDRVRDDRSNFQKPILDTNDHDSRIATRGTFGGSMKTTWVLAVAVLEVFLAFGPAIAGTCEKWVARATSVQGKVHALRQGEKQ